MDLKVYSYSTDQKLQHGEDVRCMQEIMNEIRYYTHGNWNSVPTNGVYDKQTADAVRGIQQALGIFPSNGVLDQNLQMKLMNERFNIWRIKDMRLKRAQAEWYRQQQAKRQATYVVQDASFFDTYVWPPLDAFMKPVKELLAGIVADIWSIVCGFKEQPVSNWWTHIVGKLKTLVFPKMKELVAVLKNSYAFLKNIPSGISNASRALKDYAYKLLTIIRASPREAKVLFSVDGARKFANNNIAGIVICGLPAIYYFIRWIFCKESEKEKFWNMFTESFKSFIGALIVMALIQVAAGAAVAAGVVTLKVGVVAAIIGLVVAFFDLLLVCFTRTGAGDFIMMGIDYVEVAIFEKAIIAFDWAVEKTVETGKAVSNSISETGKAISNYINNGIDNASRVYSRGMSELFNPLNYMGR